MLKSCRTASANQLSRKYNSVVYQANVWQTSDDAAVNNYRQMLTRFRNFGFDR
jgi:hypothetical protein